jgi:hypothetical protein
MDLGIAWFSQPFEDHGQRFIGIDKYTAHGSPSGFD